MEFRVPPHNLEAEQAVLGSILIESKTLMPEYSNFLSVDDFYRNDHQEIYKVMVELYGKNKPVDLLTVSDKLPEALSYMSEIAFKVSTTANAKYYAGIVKAKSIRRKFIKAAQDVMDIAFDGDYESVIDFKNDVLQKMDIEVKDNRREASDMKTLSFLTAKEIDRRYKSNDDSKKAYGFTWLDKKTGGVHDSDLTILAARPSVGKTSFALQICINLAKKKNHIAFFSLEMSKEQLMEKILSNESGVDSQKIRYIKNLDDAEWKKLGHASEVVAEYPINIYDTTFKIEDIRATCRDLKNKGQLDFAVVDYLQLCNTLKKCKDTQDRVATLSRDFKLLAKELKTSFMVLSQLTRANEKDNRQPKLIDLRESGAIEQDADNVFFLHDENYGKYENEDNDKDIIDIQLIIAKQRNGKRDILTDIKFRKATQRFFE